MAPVVSASHWTSAAGHVRMKDETDIILPMLRPSRGLQRSWGHGAKPFEPSWPAEKRATGSNTVAAQPAPRKVGASGHVTKVLPATVSQLPS